VVGMGTVYFTMSLSNGH